MIPVTASKRHPGWQQLLAGAITDPGELLARLGLGPEWLAPARAAARSFPLRVPSGFVARMGRSDPRDPLLRQVLPLAEECLAVAGYTKDPVGDRAAHCAPGLLQKYTGRVLLTASGACAVHCRYCFRRHFPYGDENASANGFRAALAGIAADSSIREVILSGGDPLTLSDRRLHEFSAALSAIAHVLRLRIHTRLPVVLPERIDAGFLGWLRSLRIPVVIVIHANHPNELDGTVAAALAALKAEGAVLLNQSVLLKGINDDVGVLAQLSERLLELGVLPYYLHQLDRVAGAAHFEVPDTTARQLYEELRNRLPGYLVPRLVREQEGAPAKWPV